MRDLAARLKPILDRRAIEERSIVPKAVQGRNADGTLQLRPQDGECVLRGSVSANYAGQIINEAPSPTFDRRGLSGSAIASTGGESTLWIERLEPSELIRGETMTVLVIGRGITASTRVEFADGVLTDRSNPDLEIKKQTFLDPSHLELEVEISEDARLVRNAALLYDS